MKTRQLLVPTLLAFAAAAAFAQTGGSTAPAAGAGSTSASASAKSSSTLDKKDQKFMMEAAAGGMFEVEAGKLAESKGQDAQVKSYGAMLVKDHSAANEELKALAAAKGVTLPTSLPKDKQKDLDKLGKAKHFDKDFINHVGQHDHKKDISLFEKASKDAKDPDVKAFAAKTLPVLRTHHEQADTIEKGMKGKKAA